MCWRRWTMRGLGRGSAGASRALTRRTPQRKVSPASPRCLSLSLCYGPVHPYARGEGTTRQARAVVASRRRGAAVMASPLSAATVKAGDARRAGLGTRGRSRFGGVWLGMLHDARAGPRQPAKQAHCCALVVMCKGARRGARMRSRDMLCDANPLQGEPTAAGRRPAGKPTAAQARRQPSHACVGGEEAARPRACCWPRPQGPDGAAGASLPPRACLASGFLGAPALSPPVTRAPPYPAASPRCASLWGQQAPAAGSSRHHRLLRAPTLPKGIVPLTGA